MFAGDSGLRVAAGTEEWAPSPQLGVRGIREGGERGLLRSTELGKLSRAEWQGLYGQGAQS